jgi:nucleoside-diphosphate-sugar epimerase
MRILVTGGTGFLGNHLIRALQERGHWVRALGRNEAACRTLASKGIDVVRADLRDAAAVRAACAEMDAVYHVGALSAPWGPAADFHAVNVDGTSHVLTGCRVHRITRFIHVSSPSVTFAGRDVMGQTEAAPYPRRFLSAYSWSKKLAEDRVNAAAREGLATVIIRPKAMFGPGDTTLLPRLLDAARRGRLPQVGAGRNLVDLTYVDNIVHALVLALRAPAAVGRTYTITNGEPVSLWDVIKRVLRQLDISAELLRLPYRVAYLLAGALECRARIFGGEPVLTRYTAAILGRFQTYDISAARRDLDYAPPVPLAAGLERTLAALQGGNADA